MENLIYPKPSEITFDLSGWYRNDTMFKNCSIRISDVPSTSKPIAAPTFEEMTVSADRLILRTAVYFDGKYPNEKKTFTLELYSFPLRNIEFVDLSSDATSSVSTYYEGNALAAELSLGKLTMASICEYEPITRKLPGNIKTAAITLNLPREYNTAFVFTLEMRPAPGVILRH